MWPPQSVKRKRTPLAHEDVGDEVSAVHGPFPIRMLAPGPLRPAARDRQWTGRLDKLAISCIIQI